MDQQPLIIYGSPDVTSTQYPIQKLKTAGFRVELHTNATTILAQLLKVDSERPDIFITDTFLPHGEEFSDSETDGSMETGYAIYRLLRERGIRIPVIIFSTRRLTMEALRSIRDPNLFPVEGYDLKMSDALVEKARQVRALLAR